MLLKSDVACRLLVCLVFTLSIRAACADNWPSWRGPQQDGTANPGKYPLKWSDTENQRWSDHLPGKSGSTPVVWKDRLAMTLPIDEQNAVLCLDLNGKELWRKTLGKARPGKHRKGSGANPSPVTDGNVIIAYYKSGDFSALDWKGNILWHENLQEKYGEDTLWWDLGTSPVLTSKHVVVACVQSGPSYLAAFDKLTGKEVWKVDRNLGAPEEAAQTYSTPVVTTYKGQEQIVVLGADHVTCHDAGTGKELWRVGGLNPDQEKYFRSIASPVMAEDIVIAPYARGKSLTAIQLGGSGDVTTSHVLWSKPIGSDVPTPATHDGKVYVAGDKGAIICLEAKTGKEIWSVTLEKNRNSFSASPVLAGDRLYLVREDAKTFVLNANDGEILATNSVGEKQFCLATPVFVDDEILLRTFEEIYCIAKPEKSVSSR